MRLNPAKEWFPSLMNQRRELILGCEILLMGLAYYVSFLLRFDFHLSQTYFTVFLHTLPILLLVKFVIFYWVGLFRGWWCYAGVNDLWDISKAAAISSPLVYVLVICIFDNSFPYPRSVLIIDFVLTIVLMGQARFAVRLWSENAVKHLPRKNTLIIGAGHTGALIARELKSNPGLDFRPLGFIDDDPTKHKVKIEGTKVLGGTRDLPRLMMQKGVHSVIIAMPSASANKIQEIMNQCHASRVELKIFPKIADQLNGSPAVKRVRSVRVEDLLGREPVRLDLEDIRKRFGGKNLFITGAGGSIGSELVRQLAGFRPNKLVLFERSESDLHNIEIEVRDKYRDLHIVPVVGDILDVRLLRDLMAEYRLHSVFHAAAYKHVPMMEKNCFQAVTNNIFGTYNVALVARQFGVEDFVMISSDKAVNPTNIMGVTKRIAELVILGLQWQHTRFVAVRFGNVLGSNGSVLPLFERQVARGGPVTVTHRDARRYFMTIFEAVQLVLQASIMGHGGEIFLLDMGEPVRIEDLARNLIRLSGLQPDRNIKLVYTGLRPGEKLFEELKLEGEGIKSTAHEKIRVLAGGHVDFAQVQRWLDDLSVLVEVRNVHGLVRALQQIVPEYTPSPQILSLCEIDHYDLVAGYKQARNGLSFTSGNVA